MTAGKTIALTRRTFVGKVMSLLFNMLSRLLITFLPRSKRLLISWLQSPSAVILEPPKIKSDTVSPSISLNRGKISLLDSVYTLLPVLEVLEGSLQVIYTLSTESRKGYNSCSECYCVLAVYLLSKVSCV